MTHLLKVIFKYLVDLTELGCVYIRCSCILLWAKEWLLVYCSGNLLKTARYVPHVRYELLKDFSVPLLYSPENSEWQTKKSHPHSYIRVRGSTFTLVHVGMLSHFSCAQPFASPWAVGHQAPLSMEFSRQEEWSGLPCSHPGDLPNPGIKPASLMSPALAGGIFTSSLCPRRSPQHGSPWPDFPLWRIEECGDN